MNLTLCMVLIKNFYQNVFIIMELKMGRKLSDM